MGFKKINSLKVSLFTHLVVALVFSIIFSFAVQNIAGHMKETIWLEYIDADELYEFQNKYSSQFGGMISVDRKSTRLNSSHQSGSRIPSCA